MIKGFRERTALRISFTIPASNGLVVFKASFLRTYPFSKLPRGLEEQEHKAKLARIQARKEQQEKEAQETAKQSENIEKESKQVNENDEKSKSSSSAGE